MKFVADESLDFPVVITLREAGHDVYSIKGQYNYTSRSSNISFQIINPFLSLE